jgi:ubiquinone/menaquinone biosynthesis C-methylase UbiE
MVRDNKIRVCPVERAGSLDLSLRRWFQNPRKILTPYVKEGMKVMDLGCGPGFFTLDLARLVRTSGRVIAADLQQGMLDRLKTKIHGTEFQNRIVLHKCPTDKIGLSEKMDFVLVFYMVHEVPDQEGFFKEIAEILTNKGRVFIVEPLFHVSKSDFEKTIRTAKNAGFGIKERPKVLFSKSALLEKG